MLKSLKKIFNKRTDYNKFKKVITPVPPKFIHALMDSINLGLIDKAHGLLSDISSGELANIIEQLDESSRKKLIFFIRKWIIKLKYLKNQKLQFMIFHTIYQIIQKYLKSIIGNQKEI